MARKLLQILRVGGSGPEVSRKMPQRVENTILEQQNESERLIGWMQLLVVGTFGALYLSAPSTFHPDAPFEPVPWVLAAYFLFTIIRLIWSYTSRLPGWFVSLSIVADILLLFGAIYSFHIQYMQPPAFYLKAPTFLYIFIFIGLRALRFEARYILLCGITGAAGWIVMLMLAIQSQHPEQMVTRDYVEYLTSNAILIGGEFDKIIAMILVTGILAVAVIRARSLLVRAVSDAAAVKSLERFFSPTVAEQITTAEKDWTVGKAELRQASILNVDIRGFTPLTRLLSPQEQIELVIEYQARMVPIITKFHGEVDKFAGDGIMAYFGAVEESVTYAADALHCMEEILAESDRWNVERAEQGLDPIVIHTSTATGPVIYGVTGDENLLDYTVLGDAANLSAKMEKMTKTEGTRAVATANTFKDALVQGYEDAARRWEIREKRSVSGVSDPLDIVIHLEAA